MPPSKVPETETVPEIDTEPAELGHAPVGVPVLGGVVVGLAVGVVVGVVLPPAYVSNSAIRGALDAALISKVIFFSEVEVKVTVPGLPLPLFRTALVSALSSRQELIVPPPDACVMTAEDTAVALLHLTETYPVVLFGDQ
ncbi:hypothetical protein GCM10010435_60710 [Winogradskya consettensis]|uniref:Uncharacterized protein n=1 Tax=Winogradskya consettensis TaxID=113560 RepID=A0A919W1A9_9ACTN|nr:hypothetical protein Aco04nite_49850 [Actinoplanes consettensis]